MIGGIGIFLPLNPGEENFCVANDTAEERKPTVTVREEELEKISEAAQEKEENEHSAECLNAFSQEFEEAAALKLTTEEA